MSPTKKRVLEESQILASGRWFRASEIAEELGIKNSIAIQLLTQLATDWTLRARQDPDGGVTAESLYQTNRVSHLVSRRPWDRSLGQALEQVRA